MCACVCVFVFEPSAPYKLSLWLHLQIFTSASFSRTGPTSSFLPSTMKQDLPGCYDFRPVPVWNASKLRASLVGRQHRTHISSVSNRSSGRARQDAAAGRTPLSVVRLGQSSSRGSPLVGKCQGCHWDRLGFISLDGEHKSECECEEVSRGERREAERAAAGSRTGCHVWIPLKDEDGFCYLWHAPGFDGEHC